MKKTWLIIGVLIIIVIVGLYANKQGGFGGIAGDQTAAPGVVYCEDSDGGANTAVKGTTRTYKIKANGTQQTTSTSTDSCSNATTVTEYWCNGSSKVSTVTPCAGSCVNGACVTGGTGDTTAPTVALASPASGATLTGTATLSATASDNVGVTKVDFYRGTTLLGTDTTAPYSYSWVTSGVSNGSYTLSAKAYDAANNVGTSASVSVTVSNTTGGTGDTTAPTVGFIKPPWNGNYRVTGNALEIRIYSSETATPTFYRNGVQMNCPVSSWFDASSGYQNYYTTTCDHNTTTALGTHTLTVQACDASNNCAMTNPVTVEYVDCSVTSCGTKGS